MQMNKICSGNVLDTDLKTFLAGQIRSLRGDMSQGEFGRLIGKPQSVVSRLEDPTYGKVTLQTLLDIAAKLDIALIVSFTNYRKYHRIINEIASNPIKTNP